MQFCRITVNYTNNVLNECETSRDSGAYMVTITMQGRSCPKSAKSVTVHGFPSFPSVIVTTRSPP